MGKKIFATLIVAIVAMFAGYNVYQSQNTVALSELALANVEALANDNEWAPVYYLYPCPSKPGNECTSKKYDYTCVQLTYCR